MTIGFNCHHVEPIDFQELVGFGHRRTCHASDFLIELKEVLQRDGCQCLRLFLDLHTLFGFHSLVQSVTPLTTFHESPGKLVYDDYATFFDDVIDVTFVEVVGFQRVIE